MVAINPKPEEEIKEKQNSIVETTTPKNQELIINELVINEFYPEANSYKNGPMFQKSELTDNIQSFFADHILNSVINNHRSRTGRFVFQTSSILSDIKNILKITTTNIKDSDFELILSNNQEQKDFTEDSKRFYYFSNNISKKFKQTLTNKAKNEFLLVIIKCTHIEHGELVAILKMEKLFGVHYSARELHEQLNMLPDKKSGLQKAAVIFKDKLIQFSDLKAFENDPTSYHTKIVDKQDTTISKSFIEAFLGNSIIHKNIENTLSAFSQIQIYFENYLLPDFKKNDVEKFLTENTQYKSTTTVKELVEKVISDSPFIDKNKLSEKNLGTDEISITIYKEMQKQNSSASAEFQIELRQVPKQTFIDTRSEGKLLKLTVAQTSLDKQDVLLNVDVSDLDSIANWEDKIFIAISKDMIDLNKK